MIRSVEVDSNLLVRSSHHDFSLRR